MAETTVAMNAPSHTRQTMVMVPAYLDFRVMPRFVCIFDFVFSAARLGSMDRRTPGRESPAAA
jgi:hypothetical protein